jgi:hypothetical protein
LRPYWLGPPPAPPIGLREFFGRSGAAATLGSGVSSAASSAVVGVRFGAPARDRLHFVRGSESSAGTAGRAGSAGPADCAYFPSFCAVLRTAAKRGRWTIHRTPLLRFWSPAALACHVACLCREAPPLRPSRFDRWPASSVLLRPGVRVRSRAMDRSIRSHRASRATPCTHAPALTLAVPAVFRLAEMAQSTLRGSTPRVLAGTLRRSRRAPLHRTHAEPTTGHAPARSWSAGVPLPAVGVTWPGRAPFRRREACLGFRPVNLAGNEAGLSSRV